MFTGYAPFSEGCVGTLRAHLRRGLEGASYPRGISLITSQSESHFPLLVPYSPPARFLVARVLLRPSSAPSSAPSAISTSHSHRTTQARLTCSSLAFISRMFVSFVRLATLLGALSLLAAASPVPSHSHYGSSRRGILCLLPIIKVLCRKDIGGVDINTPLGTAHGLQLSSTSSRYVTSS